MTNTNRIVNLLSSAVVIFLAATACSVANDVNERTALIDATPRVSATSVAATLEIPVAMPTATESMPTAKATQANLSSSESASAIEQTDKLIEPTPGVFSVGETQHLQLPRPLASLGSAPGVESDGKYIYWELINSGDIYRYPLDHGEIEIFATTSFEHVAPSQPGEVPFGVMTDITIGEDWLIVADSKASSLATPFKLKAINLQDKTEKLIDSSEEATPIFAFAVSRNSVVWTRLHYHEDENCQVESVLTVMNLETDERRELDRICADDNYRWGYLSGIGISEDKVIVVKQFSDVQGGGIEVHLFDLATGQSQTISRDDGRKFGPTISGAWTAWVGYPNEEEMGPESPPYTVLYNWQTGEYRELHPDYEFGLDEPFIEQGRWLYWDDLGSTPWQLVYDLETGEEVRFPTNADNFNDGFVDDWQIRGNTIIWSKSKLNGEMDPSDDDVYLYWKTGADLNTLLTQEAAE